jgi:NADH-quinone oxidoreductase subunit B
VASEFSAGAGTHPGSVRTVALDGNESGFATTSLGPLLAWARKYSLFQYPFVTACCGMEFMSVASPRFDVARFGAEAPRFSPRQSDLLWVVGTISQRQAPVLRRIYQQMMEPKWVLAFGTCASCGGFYDNYTTIAGIDKIIPCDVYVPGCPPRPEAVLDGLLLLQDKIARGDRTPGVVKPREDPLVTLRTSAEGAATHPRPSSAKPLKAKASPPPPPRHDGHDDDEEEEEDE